MRSRSKSPRRSRYSPSFGPKQSPPHRKAQPNFNLSGKLAEERLRKNGVMYKYDEPSDKALPTRKWRMHVFKGDAQVGVLQLGDKSCYRFGRDPAVSDVLIEHESCSKQHAVIQHREITNDLGFGKYTTEIKPFLIDLDSTHGTFLNGSMIDASRFVELRPMDIVKFACSTREYVFLAEDQVSQ